MVGIWKLQISLPMGIWKRVLPTAAHLSGGGAPDSMKALLEAATSMQEAAEIVSAVLIAKVRNKFSLAADVPVSSATQLQDLGIDSPVGVVLRTWFARELAVDIPLLRVMGGISIEELTTAAVSTISPGLLPHVKEGHGKGSA